MKSNNDRSSQRATRIDFESILQSALINWVEAYVGDLYGFVCDVYKKQEIDVPKGFAEKLERRLIGHVAEIQFFAQPFGGLGATVDLP